MARGASAIIARRSALPLARQRWLWAGGIYLLLGVFAWWRVWSGAPGSTIPAHGSDPHLTVWFVGWTAHALAHGLNPFYSNYLDVPLTVNLVGNASIPLVGAVLAPVTYAFGPVAATNVGLTVAPALSALAGFAACRRYAGWAPAAFVGGLLYGFSPTLLDELRVAHLHVALLPVPPLVLLSLDELIVRRRRNPIAVGTLLGLLLGLEALISLEVIALTAVLAVVGGLYLTPAALRASPSRAEIRHVAIGLGTAAVVAGCLLAYPVWAFFFGPGHYSGPLFPAPDFSTTLVGSLLPGAATRRVSFVGVPDAGYLGIPLVLILVLARIRLRRVLYVRRFCDMAAICWVLSLGYWLYPSGDTQTIPLPAALLRVFPGTKDIFCYRFSLFTALFAALALAVVLDHLRRAGRSLEGHLALPALAVPGTAALALVPILLVTHWPYSVAPIHPPPALADTVRTLPSGSVIATDPQASPFAGAPMSWQAMSGFSYRMLGGYAFIPRRPGLLTGVPPPEPLGLIFAAGAAGRLGPSPAPATASALRTEARSLNLAALIILPVAPGAAAVRSYLSHVFGKPRSTAQGWLWRWPGE